MERQSLNEVIELYPNPVFNNLQFRYQTDKTEMLHLKIFNIWGQLIIDDQYKTSTYFIVNREYLKSGIYFIQLSDSDQRILQIGKFLVQ